MITRVGIVARPDLKAAASHLTEIAAWLRDRHVEAVFDPETAAVAGVDPGGAVDKDRLPTRVDLILVLGGDGTLLDMAGRIGEAGTDIPILGINFGGLGFLTEITLAELYPSLEAALSGRAEFDARMTLQATIQRRNAVVAARTVLNDVVITQGALSRIIELSVTVDRDFVTRVRADGLIIASPTGSTAYNLSAGGPILHPRVDAFTLTPIAPHTFTNRPLVIPGSATVTVQPHVETSRDEIHATLDGQFGFRLEEEDRVVVCRSPRSLRLVKATSRSYFEVLRTKLNWGQQ